MCKIEELKSQYFEIGRELRKELIKNITSFVERSVGKRLYMFNEYESISIGYDGGKHPEYASNMFAELESIYKYEDTYYCETEDGDMLLCYISNNELIDIWDAIKAMFTGYCYKLNFLSIENGEDGLTYAICSGDPLDQRDAIDFLVDNNIIERHELMSFSCIYEDISGDKEEYEHWIDQAIVYPNIEECEDEYDEDECEDEYDEDECEDE